MSGDANRFTGVRVFSATMQGDREALGDRITNWIATHPALRVVDLSVHQSSDHSFHCLTIVLFYIEGRPLA